MSADCGTQTEVRLPARVRCLWSSHISEPTAIVDEAEATRDDREHRQKSEDISLLIKNDMSAKDPRRKSGGGGVSEKVRTHNVDSHDVKGNAKQGEAMVDQEEMSPIKSDSGIFDFDELDSDDESYYDRAAGLGGRSLSTGEEAFYQGVLSGGEQYVIVIGAGTGQGAYELQVREVQ